MAISRNRIASDVLANYDTFGEFIAAVGSNQTSLIVAEDITLESDTSYDCSYIHFEFKNGAKLTGTNCTVNIYHPIDESIDWQIFGDNVTVVFNNKVLKCVKMEWFGGLADGITDCSPALQRLVDVCANNIPIVCNSGIYKFNTTISLNNVDGVNIQGTGKQWAIGTTFYCKDIDGFFLNKYSGSPLRGVNIKGIFFDGSDGNTSFSTSYDDPSCLFSETWLGVYTNDVISAAFVYMSDCVIGYTKSPDAIGFDFKRTFFFQVDLCYFVNIGLGYGTAGFTFGDTGTTATFNKCYWHGVRQVAGYQNFGSVTFNECVFESSMAAIYSAYSGTFLNGCGFENMGHDMSHTGIDSGITEKISIGGEMDTIIYQHNGQFVANQCAFGYTELLIENTNLKGIFEGSGLGGPYGQNGSAVFESCFYGTNTDRKVPFFYNEYIPVAGRNTKFDFKYHVFDNSGDKTSDRILKDQIDIRAVDRGNTHIQIGRARDVKNVEIVASKIILDSVNDQLADVVWDYWDAPIEYAEGDRIKLTNPGVYKPSELVCTSSGYDGSKWIAGTTYYTDSAVRPNVANGYIYIAITNGSSGGSEPTWPTSIGATVIDNTVTWECLGAMSEWGVAGTLSKNKHIRHSIPANTQEVVISEMPISVYDKHSWEIIYYQALGLDLVFKIDIMRLDKISHSVSGFMGLDNFSTIKIVEHNSSYSIILVNESIYPATYITYITNSILIDN